MGTLSYQLVNRQRINFFSVQILVNLIRIRYLWVLFFFGDTQTSDNISFEVSVQVTFHSHVTVQSIGGCCGRDRMVVGLITTYAISAYHL